MIALYAHASGSILGARETQEDSHLCTVIERIVSQPSAPGAEEALVSELLVVVCDGMGGHAAGEVASQIAARTFASTYERLVTGADGASGVPAGADGVGRSKPESGTSAAESAEIVAIDAAVGGEQEALFDAMFESIAGARPLRRDDPLLRALLAANAAVGEATRIDPDLRGMGCTLVAATFSATGVRWVSVGDSLLYRQAGQQLERLNEDHSMAPVLDDLAHRGLMDRYEARMSPRRHQLRSAITGHGLEMVDLRDHELSLNEGDWVLVATDGLETLSEDHICGLVSANAAETADTLVDTLLVQTQNANEPGQDNTTIVAVQARSGDVAVGQTMRTLPRTQPRDAWVQARPST